MTRGRARWVQAAPRAARSDTVSQGRATAQDNKTCNTRQGAARRRSLVVQHQAHHEGVDGAAAAVPEEEEDEELQQQDGHGEGVVGRLQ